MPFRSCARGVLIAALVMNHGTVFMREVFVWSPKQARCMANFAIARPLGQLRNGELKYTHRTTDTHAHTYIYIYILEMLP